MDKLSLGLCSKERAARAGEPLFVCVSLFCQVIFELLMFSRRESAHNSPCFSLNIVFGCKIK